MTPPTVPMPEDAANNDQAETALESESTEAGKVSTVDEHGPKACASDEAAATAESGQKSDD